MEQFDIVIVGAGPGGYTCAIRAAQLGFKTAVVEKDKTLGGTCLNVGCIPSKALLDSSEIYEQSLHEFSGHGVETSGVKLNLSAMLKRKDGVVKGLTDGIEYLFKKNKITRLVGTGRLSGQGKVEITNGSEKSEVTAKHIIIASGSVPVALPFAAFDGKRIISSTEALSLAKVPEHLLVIGGGVIGLELGSVWKRLGAKVTVIEFADRICAMMDSELSKKLQLILKKQGMQFELGAKVTAVDVTASGVSVKVEQKGETKSFAGDVCLVSIGRKPYTEGLGLKEAGVELDERGRIKIDDHFKTNVPGVYAIGDVVKGPMLAHKSEEEGVAIAELLAGKAGHVNYETVPSVVYTWPEVASVGKSEEELKVAGIAYKKGSFPFSANGRAKAMNSTDGFVKILADEKTDRVLGVHILGPRASDMIAEAVVAMEFSASSEDIARSFHAHPTLSEVMREAALAVDGRARQM